MCNIQSNMLALRTWGLKYVSSRRNTSLETFQISTVELYKLVLQLDEMAEKQIPQDDALAQFLEGIKIFAFSE